MLLIVDDDPSFLTKAQQAFGRDTAVYFAADAKQAKELMSLVGTQFSVALIDLDLRGQDGFSLIADMRRAFPELPIIAISGVVQTHVLETAKLVGAIDALRKPITPEWNAAITRAQAVSAYSREPRL